MVDSDKVICNGVYVDLDTLLDMRFAFLYRLHPQMADELVVSRDYIKRKKDNYGIIPERMFNAIYEKRSDKKLISEATPTSIASAILPQLLFNKRAAMLGSGDNDIMVLYINTYPYVLTEDEAHDISAYYKHIYRLAGNNGEPIDIIDVVIVSHSNAEITPALLNKLNVDIFIKYDIMCWLGYHIGMYNITDTPIRHVLAYAPAIATGSIASSSITYEMYAEVLPKLYEHMITLLFIDGGYFSSAMLLNLATLTPTEIDKIYVELDKNIANPDT